jgi:uncharacterized protein YndB with AHSA1/START domain
MAERLRLTRTLGAPVERVWRAFTDPARLAAWLWPERAGTVAEIDLRPGGLYRIDGRAAGFGVTGEYRIVEPPRLLVFTWQWAGEEEVTLVTLTLAAAGAGTELTLVHEQFASATVRDEHRQGWSDCLDRLPAHLARDAAEPVTG